jgi:septum formation protein
MRLTLASTSPSRLQLLRMAGVEPVVVAPEVDEVAVADAAGAHHDAKALVELLAVAKAEAVWTQTGPEAGLVLGCDSAFEFEGVVYGKPHHAVVAASRWRAMRGRTGVLHTGHCLIESSTGDRGLAVVSAEVAFADVSDAEIDWYVASGEPLQVAGAFTLEGLAAPFIRSVTGDPHAVVGLSLAALRELALGLGVAWPDLALRGHSDTRL